MARRRTELPALKLPVPFDLHIRDHHRQHRFVHVDSCDSIGHTHLPAGAENVPLMVLVRVTGCHTTTPSYSLMRARSGSSTTTASVPPLCWSTSPLAPAPFSQPGTRFSSAFAS